MSEATQVLEGIKSLTAQEPPAPPLTGPQLEAKIGELSLALESGTLAPEMRKHIEAARADLIRQQYLLVHDFLPDEDGNRPLDVAAIAETATKSVIETLSAESLQSQLEPLAVIPTPKETPQAVECGDGAVLLSAEVANLLRASIKAGLTETTIHVLSVMLKD